MAMAMEIAVVVDVARAALNLSVVLNLVAALNQNVSPTVNADDAALNQNVSLAVNADDAALRSLVVLLVDAAKLFSS